MPGKEDLSAEIALVENGVAHAADGGEVGIEAYERGMHAQRDFVFDALGDGEQANGKPAPFGEVDIVERDLFDAFDGNLVKRGRRSKGESSEQRDLLCRIEPLRVGTWIGFGVALLLSASERRCKVFVLRLQSGEDVVASAVDDSCDALRVVGEQALSHRCHHRHGSRDGGFPADDAPLGFGEA